MTTVFQIVFGVIVLVFMVVAGLSSRTWRALHVVAVYFVFFAAVAFTIFAASSMKTREKWKQESDQLEKQLAVAVAAHREILHGDPSLDKQTKVTLIDARARLTRFSLDRGRVWRECSTSSGGTVAGRGLRPIVKLSTNPSGAEPRPNRIEAGAILYVFREKKSADGHPIPVAYIGEFHVTAATDGDVTMEPIDDLQPYQLNQLVRATLETTWVLYEVMPLDDHRSFTDPNERVQIEQDNASIYGVVDEAEVRRIFELVNAENFLDSPQALTAEQLEELIELRLHDGTRAKAGDPNRNVFMKVQFTKPYKVTVDTAGTDSNLLSHHYDAQGTAIPQRLKRGEDVRFKVDDIGVLHVDLAQQLIADDTCVLLERIFIRDLTDYDQWFFTVRNQLRRLALVKIRLDAVKKRLDDAEARVAEMTTYRQSERVKLEDDQANVDKERAALTTYIVAKTAARADVLTKLSKLYQRNNALAALLSEIHERIRTNIQAEIDAAP
ncbi:MAG: hypothetical protein VB878_07380 [Pirellulaceae bacterium]